MEVGDRVTFPFGSGEKEGVVTRICEKKVYLRVDFPRQKGKIVTRPLYVIGTKPKARKKKKGKSS